MNDGEYRIHNMKSKIKETSKRGIACEKPINTPLLDGTYTKHGGPAVEVGEDRNCCT